MRKILLGLVLTGVVSSCGVTASAAPIGAAIAGGFNYQAASVVIQVDLIPGWRKRAHKRYPKWLPRRRPKSNR